MIGALNVFGERAITGFTNKNTGLAALLEKQGLKDFPLVRMGQSHSNNCKYISNGKSQEINAVDAVFTDQKALVLTVRTADCLPIFIYHPKNIIAVVHSGRVGTEKGIARNVLKQIKKQFSLQNGFSFWFGPAICKKCYQIDKVQDIHFDLIGENEKQIKAECPDAKIYYSNICTACKNDFFYSYRKGDNDKRNYGFIVLK
ncbi:polyphenol oxidase family protein [Candidatus Margulisiibacteriota bacterium]